MKNRNKKTAANFINALELPKDVMLGLPDMELTGNRELFISNHRGILSYSQEEIEILAKDIHIIIMGKQLYIESYSGEEVVITGYMEEIRFC
uniref:sporulation protein YqfC n=1 Tax=Agathobacter sp. TaxID=2021311 RepID=UPI004057960B